MNILISNDDGYSAKGVNELAQVARKFGNVTVVAPDSPRSGASLSITSQIPVRNKLIKMEPATQTLGSLEIWSCSGTPSDCVKMAFEIICQQKPDLVLGGINHGDNSAVNAHYSGTMAVALEGCIKKVPSIAISSKRMAEDADFSYMMPYVERIISHVIEKGLPVGVCLNVNAPKNEDIKGMRICRMGMGEWYDEWQTCTHPHGGTYYWIAGYYAPDDTCDEQTDSWALDNDYVAITPVQLDLTAYSAMQQLRQLELTAPNTAE